MVRREFQRQGVAQALIEVVVNKVRAQGTSLFSSVSYLYRGKARDNRETLGTTTTSDENVSRPACEVEACISDSVPDPGLHSSELQAQGYEDDAIPVGRMAHPSVRIAYRRQRLNLKSLLLLSTMNSLDQQTF